MKDWCISIVTSIINAFLLFFTTVFIRISPDDIPKAVAVGGNSGVIFCIEFEIYSGNVFIVFVQIINIMQHILKEVKAVTKKYPTKSGVKESISKRVDLGVTDIFETGECVAVISKTNFDNIDETIADKDATIVNLNDSIAKHKVELESKTNIIGDLSKEIKALKTKVAELESDISAKDETIGVLTSKVTAKDETIADSGNVIDGLNAKVDELTSTVGELKPLLLTKDSTIAELEKQIAIYGAMDVDELKEKSKKLDATIDELDKSKNVIIRFQNEKMELKQLVNYHKEKATAYKNQRWYKKALGRDATADISTPTLVLFDLSGNDIVNDKDATDDATAIGDSDDSGKTSTSNDN